jgi:hypothetical protein
VGGGDKEGATVTDGETYLKTRLDLGLSRADVSAMAKRAGHNVSQSSIDRLEKKGTAAVGGRGLPYGAVGWIEYLYGMSSPEGVVKWPAVERGAPVIVHGEKGAFQFQGVNNDGSIAVFGGRRNEEKFRAFPVGRVRLVALTTLPPPELSRVFESRHKGSDSAYAAKVMAHIRDTPGAHSVGAIAYMLGMNNAIVSRVAADLAKKGELVKVNRGVFVLPCPPVDEDLGEDAPTFSAGSATPPPEEQEEEAASVKSALAERVMAPGHRSP